MFSKCPYDSETDTRPTVDETRPDETETDLAYANQVLFSSVMDQVKTLDIHHMRLLLIWLVGRIRMMVNDITPR